MWYNIRFTHSELADYDVSFFVVDDNDIDENTIISSLELQFEDESTISPRVNAARESPTRIAEPNQQFIDRFWNREYSLVGLFKE